MQMLAIARAISAGAKVLLLDEPSQGLAPLMVREVYAALESLNSEGLAIVLVEQKAVPLWREPDETVVLASGRVVHRVANASIPDDELADLYMGEHL
jgi:branched-chain amino acid transport system ATP-binding protein